MHYHDPFRAQPTALLGVASFTPAGTYGPADVPSKATDVVAWLKATDGDDAVARALAAQAVEMARDEGDRRSTVLAAIGDVLG